MTHTLNDPDCPKSVRDQINGGVTQEAALTAKLVAAGHGELWVRNYLVERSEAMGHEVDEDEIAESARDINAALSAQPVQGEAEPVAKALEWTETLTQRSDEDPTLEVTGFETTTLFGTSYQIETGAAWFTVIYDYGILAECQTEQEAKAAAQSDFDQRVQSCLAAPQPKQPAPAQDGEARPQPYHAGRWLSGDDGWSYPSEEDAREASRSKQAPTVAVIKEP